MNFRSGEQWGVMRESSGARSRATTSIASLRPGDVVQVRLVERERQGKWNGE